MSGLSPLNLLKTAVWRASFVLRETGQALERVGCQLQGIYSHEERVNRHVSVASVKYDAPVVPAKSFVAASGLVQGKVAIGEGSSVWYGAIVRGDHSAVSIGKGSNIQDNVFVGGTSEFSPAVKIGDNVSVGHGAVLKGCTIGSNCLIGIKAVVSEGATVGANSIISAGSYVEENAEVPPNEVWAGSPAKKLRDLKPEEKTYLRSLPSRYTEMSQQHADIAALLAQKQADYTHTF